MTRLRTVFFGTPALSVPYLEAVRAQTDLQLAVTQADKPRGRGMEILPCPVKARARELGVPVLSPEKLKEAFDQIAAVPFDVGVAVAYGKIFRPNVLSLAKTGFINVHFSLLPLLRGAAPVQQALINGYTKTGISIFWINEGMDEGDLILQREISIDPDDNAQTLFEKLVPLGVTCLREALALIENGKIIRQVQTGTPTFAPMIEKDFALLNPALLSAEELHNRVRGLACGPKPKIPFTRQGKTEWLSLLQTALGDLNSQQPAGTVLRVEREKGILIQCKDRSVWLRCVQPAGKKPMRAEEFANGRNIRANELLFTN
jgi:methionyl-tRNA formyltransferase